MNYVRPSALGVAEFCSQSTALSEQSGIGRSAIISKAWHAKCEGNDTLVGELHPDERKEVAGWEKPATCAGRDLDGNELASLWLRYDDAEKELPVRVLERDSCITEGTLDFAWVREVAGRRWAFVGDLKRSTWAIPDGPDCLQLAAYGHAYCHLRNCDGYTPGLWSATDNEWTWGRPVDLTSPEALDLWKRLKRAARNDARFIDDPDKKRHVTGAHCNACYGKLRCPAYGALTAEGPVPEVTAENAAQLILKAQAMAKVAGAIEEQVKTFAKRGGVVKDPATGKVFLPVQQKGRSTLDQEALAKVVDLKKYQRTGKPFDKYDWRRA